MKICVPTIDNAGKGALLCDHFGSAPYFTIYDVSKDSLESIDNNDKDHEHGTCQPMSNLHGKEINIMVCRGLGQRALVGLNNAGIRVCRTDKVTVEGIIEEYESGLLQEMSADQTCQDHHCH